MTRRWIKRPGFWIMNDALRLACFLGTAAATIAVPVSATLAASQATPAEQGGAQPPSISRGASADARKIEGQPRDAMRPADRYPDQTAGPQTGTSAVVMDLSAIESVIGKSVKSSSGEDLGRIVDLLVTTTGQVRAAVIDFGGFLGVGSRKIAVDWKALDFANFTRDGTVRLALTRNQVRVSPEFKTGDPVVILQATTPVESRDQGEHQPDGAKPDGARSVDVKRNGEKPADTTPVASKTIRPGPGAPAASSSGVGVSPPQAGATRN